MSYDTVVAMSNHVSTNFSGYSGYNGYGQYPRGVPRNRSCNRDFGGGYMLPICNRCNRNKTVPVTPRGYADTRMDASFAAIVTSCNRCNREIRSVLKNGREKVWVQLLPESRISAKTMITLNSWRFYDQQNANQT